MNKLKKGLTYISERTGQLRYSDKHQDEKWLQPLSEYIPLEKIMRGQPVSIATADDIAAIETKLGIVSGTLTTDSNTYIVLTDPQKHTHSVGLAYEYSAGPSEDGKEIPDPIHVLGQGKFNIDLDYLVKSYQIGDASEVEGIKEYVPDFLNDYKKNIGKPIWVIGDQPGKLTISKEEAFQGYRNIIQVGFISDAWLPGQNKNEYQASIEVQIDGDSRGALDATQFEAILGEDVVIPKDDPIRVFALGQEDDVAFEGRINITPSTIKDVDTKTAFIGIQKMDGKTAIITFGEDFDITSVKNSGYTDDISFVNTAGIYNDALGEQIEFISANYYNNAVVGGRKLSDCISDTQASISKALKEAVEFVSGYKLTTDCFSVNEDSLSGYIKFKADQPGGYYYMYISEKMLDHLSNSITYHNGSSYNKETVVLADCRVHSRQNLIGVYYSGKYDQLLTKGTKCIFLKDGLFVHHTNKYQAIGKAYYLYKNGQITEYQHPGADTINKVLTVQDKEKLIVSCGDARLRIDMGNLPVGYMKPAVGEGGTWYAEYGFLLMDGETRYSCKAYDKLFTRLQAWYPLSMLKVGIQGDEIEDHFIIPRCTTSTDSDPNNLMQIKHSDCGVYEIESLVPYVREFGTFEEADEYTQINQNNQGVAYPMIGKYHKKVTDKLSGEIIEDKDVDTSIDVSSICALYLKDEKVSELSVDQLDIHLYVDPYYNTDDNKDGLIHWVEIRNGFHNYNNVTTYGFEWELRKIEGFSAKNPFGRYVLSTDIRDGMGLYYQGTGNQPLKPLSGVPYKVVVYKRQQLLKQFDLSGVVSSYISNSVLDPNGEPTTKIATTGSAVIDAIENRHKVKVLHAYPYSEGVKSEFLIGKEEDPAYRVEIASNEKMPIYSPKGIKFENSLIDGLKEACKVYLENDRLIYKDGTNEDGTKEPVPAFGSMPPNALVTRTQVEEHTKLDATKVKKINESENVHGMVFGTGGNIDASFLDGLRLATHRSKRVGGANGSDLQTTTENESYIPYTYYGTNPLDTTESDYIFSKEGYTVNQSSSHGEGATGYYSVEKYSNADNNLKHTEIVNGTYAKFVDAKKKMVGNNFVSYETIYNFHPAEDATTPETVQENSTFDIEFKKVHHGKNIEDSYASLKAAGFYSASLAKYKKIYGETINKYTPETDYPVEYVAGENNIFDLTDKTSEYIGSALQAVYEMPLAFFNYKSEPDWYKKYLGIIVDRVNDMRDHLSKEDKRSIFTEEERNWNLADSDGNIIPTSHDFSESDNTFEYTDDELKSLRTYLNSITDTSESSQNILTSVGILLKAAKETQERLLKIETSTFGADAPTIPGDRKRITFPNTPDVNPEATHLGLNRLVRAMSRELYGTANPADEKLEESNSTSSTLSKVDELEVSIDGATFDRGITTDSSDNKLSEVSSATYPYHIAETAHGGHTNLKDAEKKIYTVVNGGKYQSVVTGKEESVPEDAILYKKFREEEKYITEEDFNATYSVDKRQEVFDTNIYIEEITNNDANWDPISGRIPVEGEKEDASVHGTWTKVDLEKEQDFNLKEDGSFETNTTTNLVPADEHGRDKFNGLVDAIARICTKVNALTYTINGVDNIDSTPRRLNTIRQNIETLIKEAYFDGAPETTVEPANDAEIAKAITEDKASSKEYIDEDVEETNTQPSTPYSEKLGKKYTGISRFDQLSDDLYNYVLNCKDNTELYFSLNSNKLGEDINDNDHKAIQYTSEEDVSNKGASKKQVLLGRTFNGKQLLIDGVEDSTGATVTDFNSTHPDGNAVKSAHINVPDSIEEYQYASIIDILIDAIGDAHFRKQINKNEATSNQQLRPAETITDRIEKIEIALDNVVRKLSQSGSFEIDSKKSSSYLSESSKTIVYSIEDYIESISKWFGLSVNDDNSDNDKWAESGSAELAAGYGDENPDYLTNSKPIVNANYLIKQLLLRIKQNESSFGRLDSILGEEFSQNNNGITQEDTPNSDGTPNFDTKSRYNLSDDVTDLLLTIYGKDTTNYGRLQKQTDFEHRTLVESPGYLRAHAWSRDATLVYTKTENPQIGEDVFKSSDLIDSTGKVRASDSNTITLSENETYVRSKVDDAYETTNTCKTRFTGNSTDRNIIDDIIKELYFVPSQVTKNNTVDAKADSIDVDYKENFYNLDSGINKYDYEKKSDDGYGRIGKAIGYDNRGTLFGDFLSNEKNSGKYRRSRLQVLEDQIRHLRSILGLNLTGEDKETSVYNSEVAYGGKFGMTGLYELGKHNFDSKATRNGNMYTSGEEAASKGLSEGATAETNIFTVLFNLENAIRDIGRELGTETKYHGIKYENFEQLNTVRQDGNTIYERLAAVEDITDRLFGAKNNHNNEHDESEDDTDGILDIQWIEE